MIIHVNILLLPRQPVVPLNARSALLAALLLYPSEGLCTAALLPCLRRNI
jgi:hypothetical protein